MTRWICFFLGLCGLSAIATAQTGKVWLFSSTLHGSRKSYVDANGEAAGFDIDLLNAVCKTAGKQCRVVYDKNTNCWDSTLNVGGPGLMAGWYSGCLGWRNTAVRRLVFDYTDDMTKPAGQVFVTLPGNPGSFNYLDLTDKRIGFVDGWTSNEVCVAEKYADIIVGADLPPECVIRCQGLSGCIADLQSGAIDALFLAIIAAKGRDEFEIVSDELAPCSPGGFGLMTPTNSGVLEWFNPALQQIMSSPEYEQLCQDVITKHGDQPGLDPDELCFDMGGDNANGLRRDTRSDPW